MLQLFSIITALFAGYFFKKLPISEAHLNRILSIAVMVILIIMGYDFGSNASNLLHESFELMKIVATFSILLFVSNFLGTFVIAKLCFENDYRDNKVKKHANFMHYVYESGKYLLYVFIGIMSGYVLKYKLIYLNSIISILLFVTIFIIGFQLRKQGISIQRILANKIGIIISVIVLVSSLFAGLVSAKFLGLNNNTGLILSSGFGWYTLSGILSGQFVSQHIGTASFFIDFMREVIAIVLIPTLGGRFPMPLIAYSGATALDFTLPVIKINMGDEVVPIAITSGMILTVLVPFVIPFFCSFKI